MKSFSKISLKVIFIFLLVTALVSTAMGFIIYRSLYSEAKKGTEEQLTQCCKYLSDQFEPQDLVIWLQNGRDSDYDDAYSSLVDIKRTFELSYLFMYKPVSDGNGGIKDEVEFFFDIMLDEDSSHDKRFKLGDRYSDLQEYELLKELYSTGQAQNTEEISSESVGRLLSVFYPLKDSEGNIIAVIGAVSSMEKTREHALGEITRLIFFYICIIVAFVIFLLLYMGKNVIRPVNILSKRMGSFVSDFSEENFIPVTEIRTKDEIEQMAQAFNKMSQSLITYTNDLKTATAEQERMNADLDVAKGIRSATSAELTFPAFPERSDFELYASLKNTVYRSCSFCNYIMSDEDHLYIVIGEPVGNSLPAMLMSMLASTNIKCLAKIGYPPFRIAAETNDQLCSYDRNDNSLTVSVIIAEIELKTGRMRYVNAGMPPMLVKHPGEKYEPAAPHIQFNLGEMRSVSFAQEELTLSQGSTLIFTSYGVPEMKNSEGARFTPERITSEINAIASEKYYLNEMIDEFEKRLDDFKGENRSELDTTIIGFRYFG